MGAVLVFFLLMIIMAVCGFGGVVVGAAMGLFKLLFLIFLVIFVVSMISALRRGEQSPGGPTRR